MDWFRLSVLLWTELPSRQERAAAASDSRTQPQHLQPWSSSWVSYVLILIMMNIETTSTETSEIFRIIKNPKIHTGRYGHISYWLQSIIAIFSLSVWFSLSLPRWSSQSWSTGQLLQSAWYSDRRHWPANHNWHWAIFLLVWCLLDWTEQLFPPRKQKITQISQISQYILILALPLVVWKISRGWLEISDEFYKIGSPLSGFCEVIAELRRIRVTGSCHLEILMLQTPAARFPALSPYFSSPF